MRTVLASRLCQTCSVFPGPQKSLLFLKHTLGLTLGGYFSGCHWVRMDQACGFLELFVGRILILLACVCLPDPATILSISWKKEVCPAFCLSISPLTIQPWRIVLWLPGISLGLGPCCAARNTPAPFNLTSQRVCLMWEVASLTGLLSVPPLPPWAGWPLGKEENCVQACL